MVVSWSTRTSVFGLDEQCGPTLRPGPQSIARTHGRIEPLDLQPGAASGALDFDATLDGNDACNGGLARCRSLLGESGLSACGCENEEERYRGERPSAVIPVQRDPCDPPNYRAHTPPD
jgi:hypothetical protein